MEKIRQYEKDHWKKEKIAQKERLKGDLQSIYDAHEADDPEHARKITEKIVTTLDTYSPLSHSDIADEMIDRGLGAIVGNYLPNFKGLDCSEVADKLLLSNNANNIVSLIMGISHFKIDQVDIAKKLADKGLGSLLERFIDNFDAAHHAEIKKILANTAFSDHDPHAHHQWLLTPEKKKQANVLLRILKKERVPKEKSVGIDIEAATQTLERVDTHITTAYTDFLREIHTNQYIPETDKQEIMNPQHTTPLIDTVRLLVAQYLALKSEKPNHLSDIQDDDITTLLKEGFEKFEQIFKIDIPLYDILYTNFDELRKDKRSPLRVYLGRDGVYAYLGDRAKIVALLRKAGPHLRKKLKMEGKMLNLYPKYITYPSFIRDFAVTEAKTSYLTQKGITKESDPILFDTGYVGSVPQDILETLGFSYKEIEKRVKLLSSNNKNFLVHGAPENVDIEPIENNVKPEEMTSGFFQNPKTGIIRNIAEPTPPEEQFQFGMIRQAITRHYWLKAHQQETDKTQKDLEK